MLMSFRQRQLSVPKMLAIFRFPQEKKKKKGKEYHSVGAGPNQTDEKFQL